MADKNDRIEFLDIAKGLAILLVISHHLINDHLDHLLNSPLYRLFAKIYPSVDVFVFISGFGLTISLLKKNRTEPVRWGRWFFRRFRQVMPAYWGVLLIFNLLNYLILGNAFTIKQNLIHAFALHGIFADHFWVFTGALWYLSLLSWLYLLYPLLWLAYRKLGGARFIIGAFAIHSVLVFLSLRYHVELFRDGYMFLHPYLTFRFLTFCLGIVSAGYFLNNRSGIEKFISETGYFWTVALPLSGAWMLLRYVERYRELQEFGGLAEYFMLAALLLASAKLADGVTAKGATIILGIMGVLSFEMYLLHEPFLSKYDPGIFSSGLPDALKILLFYPMIALMAALYRPVHQAMVDPRFWRSPLTWRPPMVGEFKRLFAPLLK